jgi:NAD(P)-dependent dehydrogenase (short-subunit alcohol dehydrogenase family)
VRLRDSVVVVTGASKGIGRALALGAAREGARVLLAYRSDSEGAHAAVDEIRAGGGEAIAVRADISQVAEIEALFQTALAEFGGVDVLVNNAAIPGWANVFDTTEAQWDAVMATNLKGTFFCSLEAAKLMRGRGRGSIVNVSSNVAALGVRNLVAYATSKGGIHALTKQLAVELAPYGIRVNTFAPGPTVVDRNLADDPDYESTWAEVVPLRRTASPEEMVGAAVFLASDESSYMTGQLFYVDGGWSVYGRVPEAHLDSTAARHAAS